MRPSVLKKVDEADDVEAGKGPFLPRFLRGSVPPTRKLGGSLNGSQVKKVTAQDLLRLAPTAISGPSCTELIEGE
jgi:hypothetical protein